MTRPIPVAGWLALVTVGMLPACTHQASQEELAAVERMIQATDSMRSELLRDDSNALHHMESLFRVERPAILARFGDTLLPHEAAVLGNYHRAMTERLPQLLAERHAEQIRLDSASARLHALQHDLEHGLLERDQRTRALAMEQRWNDLLRQETVHLKQATDGLIRERRSWRSAIDSLLHP